MRSDYFDRGPKASVHFCDPATMDHPLHRLVGMGQAGWWVLTRIGCIVDCYGPLTTRKEAEAQTETWLGARGGKVERRPRY